MRAVSPDLMAQLEHGFGCWNSRNLDLMMDMYAPNAEVDLSRMLPDEGTLRGRDEILAYYDRIWDAWAGFSWTPCEAAELDDGRYAVLVRMEAEGRSSGIPVGQELTLVYTMEDGLVSRLDFEPGRLPQLQG